MSEILKERQDQDEIQVCTCVPSTLCIEFKAATHTTHVMCGRVRKEQYDPLIRNSDYSWNVCKARTEFLNKGNIYYNNLSN